MVYNNFGSQWVIGHVIWFTAALALSGLLVMLYGSLQLWLHLVIGHVICFTTGLALSGLLVMSYGSQQL